MKYARGKRIWSMVLAICLVLGMLPSFVSHVEVEAEAATISGVDSLTCSSFISNSTRRNYIDTMMKYYINNYSSLQNTLNNGKSVVFMFEGGSDYYDSYEYVDANGTTRLQAVCIVVQLNSSGSAEIVFYCEKCSSIPDDANYVTAGSETSGSTTILDGIYGFQTVNHNGNYAGFNTYCTTGWYNPYSGSTGYSGYCNGINIHTRSVSYCGGASYGWCNSAGCQVIGYGASSSNEYNEFVKAVAGISFNAYDGTQRTYSSSQLYVEKGYYVVDRQLGLLSPDGTEYGSGSLAELYTKADLAGITSFSTSARANASFDYTSKCTFYNSYCQFKTTQSTPINSQPCSAGNNDSETLETAASGTTYTAIGMYQNTGSNFWYQVKTSSGEIGYIYAGHTSYVKQLTSDITISDYDTPNGHVAGNIFYVTGTIKSTYNYLNSAAVYIHSGFGTSGTTVTGSSDTVNGKSYTLDNSTIDYNTAFNGVSAGNYTYAISVSYTNYYAKAAQTLGTNTGTKYLVAEYFVVVSSSVDQSTCSHSYSTTTMKAATCTASGTAVKSCSKCGLVTETTVAALGHSYGSWITVDATCTADGSKTRTCTACGNVETQTIAATGHAYDMVTHAATCTEYEIYEYTCGNCGDNYKLNAGELASGWIDQVPEGMDASLFNSKTQYRYSDYETTTSYETALSGYTQKSSEWVQSGTTTVNYVNSWPSGFSTSSSLYTKYNNKSNKVSASETTTTKTVVNSDAIVGYLYYHWCYAGSYYSVASSSGSYTTFHAYYSTTSPDNYTCDTSDYSYCTAHSTCSNSDWFFVTEVYAQKSTSYKKLFTYERWTDYSDWSDTAVTASSTRKVETRTVYQLKNAAKGDHTWNSGVVTTTPTCTSSGIKTYTCTACGTTKTETVSGGGHSYTSVVTAPTCTAQGYTTHTCMNCGGSYIDSYVSAKGHSYNTVVTAPTCTTQGYTTHTCANCSSSYVDTYVKATGHSWTNGVCSVCGEVCEHASYANGVCTVCGQKEPVKDYYLFGYINGADYACEGDYANLGVYKFTEGKLVVTFECDSYVGVKSADNNNWYMTSGYLGTNVKTATLYNTNSGITSADKLYVPGGVEITFTLVVNGDDTLTLSYEAAEPAYSITMSSASLALKDEVQFIGYFKIENIDASTATMGLITYKTQPTEISVETAEEVIPGAVYDSAKDRYIGYSQGVPAKEMGDTYYIAAYAQLADGSYVYSGIKEISVKKYAYTMLPLTSDENLQKLLIAMLNYGAEAQLYFGYKTDELVNADLTDAQKSSLNSYSADLMDPIVSADSAKTGNFVYTKAAFSKRSVTVTAGGALALNCRFNPAYTMDGDMTMYYWDAATYDSVDELTLENATGSAKMTVIDEAYQASVTGIAAKDIDKTIYVVGVYESDGVTYTTGVISYNLNTYFDALRTALPACQTLCEAAVVYCDYAKLYFLGK